MKIVVVSPHRDDAAFSLSLTIDAWLAARYAVDIMNCFTRSSYAPFSDAESLHPNDRLSYVTAVRAREDLAWSKMYRGPLTLTDLRLKDAPLRFRISADEVLGRSVAPSDKAIGVIQKGLNRSGGNAFVLPLALGAHVDHVTARDSSAPATAGQQPCAFYEDLPYAAWSGAGAVDAAVIDAATLLGEPLQPFFATSVQDVSAATARKRQCAIQFDSQIDGATVDQIAEFCAQYGGRERLWANAAWLRAFAAEGGDAPL